jgi:hypothetical protein
MSGIAPSRNNVGSLRIRTSAPRNGIGRKRVWNGENWLSRTEAISRQKAYALELEQIYNHSVDEYENLYQRIEEYKLMGAPPDELIHINQRLLQLLARAEQDKIEAIAAKEAYRNLRNAPITPINQRKNRKTRKSNNRR